jgi:hypothetical protein
VRVAWGGAGEDVVEGTGGGVPEAAEQRIRARGLHRAELSVEENNPRAV